MNVRGKNVRGTNVRGTNVQGTIVRGTNVLGAKAALHAFQATVSEDLQLKCPERGCKTLKMAVATVGIQEAIPERQCETVELKNQMLRPICM